MLWLRKNTPMLALILALVSPISFGLITWGAVTTRVGIVEAHVTKMVDAQPPYNQQVGRLEGRMQSVESSALRIEKSLSELNSHLFTLSGCCSDRP